MILPLPLMIAAIPFLRILKEMAASQSNGDGVLT